MDVNAAMFLALGVRGSVLERVSSDFETCSVFRSVFRRKDLNPDHEGRARLEEEEMQ